MIYTTVIHGNEPIPLFALHYLGIDQIVCNYPALIQNQRYLEKDLNQSFGTEGKTKEEIIAKEILNKIPLNESVIDFHTMSASSDPFAIIVDPKMAPLAVNTGLKHIVLMSHNIKSGHSLIDHRSGVSIEAGHHLDPNSFETVKNIVANINHPTDHITIFYEVYGIIEKTGNYQNFTLHPDGFIPVLAGEKAYPFPGLKAKIINKL